MTNKKMKVKKNIKKKNIKKPLDVKNKVTDEKSLFRSISEDINKKTISKPDNKKNILKSDPESILKDIPKKEKYLAEVKTEDKQIIIKDENHLEELIKTLPKRKVVESDPNTVLPDIKYDHWNYDNLYKVCIKSVLISFLDEAIKESSYNISREDIKEGDKEVINDKLKSYIYEIEGKMSKRFDFLFDNQNNILGLISNPEKIKNGRSGIFDSFREYEENRENKSLWKKIFNKIFKGE